MTYYNKVLDKDNLLSIVAKPLGGFKDNYLDSQPLNLIVPFDEYIDLVEYLIENDLDVLRTDIEVYKKLLSSKDGRKNPLLYKYFYYDIALSGLAELEKSYLKGKLSTRILADFGDDVSPNKTCMLNGVLDLIATWFSKQEINLLQTQLSKVTNLNFNNITECSDDTIENIYIYYLYVVYLGLALCNKNYLLKIEEV